MVYTFVYLLIVPIRFWTREQYIYFSIFEAGIEVKRQLGWCLGMVF